MTLRVTLAFVNACAPDSGGPDRLLAGADRVSSCADSSGARTKVSEPMLVSLTKGRVLAQNLARRIATRYPPVIANTPELVVSKERFEQILEAVFSDELERGRRFGFLARVALGYALKGKLREIGYGDEFVDFTAKKLGQRLTRGEE
jgi:hypothetical protein